MISSCCKSPMSVSTADEGTSFYVCDKCKKPCGIFSPLEEELDSLKQKLAICHDKNTELKNIINGLNQEVCATCSIYKMKNEALEEELRRAGEALKNGHKAIDIAMAMLIEKDSNFYPSKSVLWPLLLKVHQALKLSNLKRLMEKK